MSNSWDRRETVSSNRSSSSYQFPPHSQKRLHPLIFVILSWAGRNSFSRIYNWKTDTIWAFGRLFMKNTSAATIGPFATWCERKSLKIKDVIWIIGLHEVWEIEKLESFMLENTEFELNFSTWDFRTKKSKTFRFSNFNFYLSFYCILMDIMVPA